MLDLPLYLPKISELLTWFVDWLQARDELQQENEALRSRVELQAEQLSAMRSHLGIIRQHTVTFILDQMDALHMQRDTEV